MSDIWQEVGRLDPQDARAFGGLADAAGLKPYQQDAVRRLLDVRAAVSARNMMLREYYEGDITVDDFGVTLNTAIMKNDQVCYWPEKAVTSLGERERFDGFVFEDGYSDAALDAAVGRGLLQTAYIRHNNSKLMHGCMFACVNPAKGGAQVRFHSAETAWAEPDGNYDSGKIGFGMAVARVGYDETETGSRIPVPVQVNLYEPGIITQIVRTEPGRWAAAVPVKVPVSEPLMFAFVHKSTGTKPFGQSRITPAVRSLTRNALRTTWHMVASGAYYAAPKYALMGVSDALADAIAGNQQKYYADSFMVATRGKDGSVPDLLQFSGNSPEPFIQELKYYASQFSGATGVPLSSLGVNADQPTSSQAMAAAREELVIAARDDIAADSAVLRRMALAVMALAAGSEERLTDEQRTVTAHFLAPDMPSAAAMADSTLKEVQALPWLADTDIVLERLGYEQSDIMRMQRARDAYSAQNALMGMFADAEGGE